MAGAKKSPPYGVPNENGPTQDPWNGQSGGGPRPSYEPACPPDNEYMGHAPSREHLKRTTKRMKV